MAHGLTEKDTMFSVRETPWHGLGVVLRRAPRSIEDALRKAGLAWKVKQEPVYRAGTPALKGTKHVSGQGVWDLEEGYKFNVRADTGDVLGVVSDRYVVVNNVEGFAFLSELIGSEVHFETAGSLHGGKRVFVTCTIPDWIEVGGDAVKLYLNCFLRHDGSGAVYTLTTPVRTVCQNTWEAAWGQAVNTYRIRHVGDPSGRLHDARAALKISVDYGKQFRRFGDRLAKQKISERKLAKITEELWPGEGSDRSVKSAQRRREAVVHLFLEGTPGPRGITTVGNAPGTKWCAANALLESIEWGVGGRAPRTDQARFLRHVEDNDGLKKRAVEAVVAA